MKKKTGIAGILASIFLAVSIVITIAGCGKSDTQEETENEMGRFEEVEGTIPDPALSDVICSKVLSDGSFMMIGDADDTVIYQSTDNGKTWTNRAYDLSKTGEDASLSGACIGRNGSIAFTYEDVDTGETQVWILQKDNSLNQLNIKIDGELSSLFMEKDLFVETADETIAQYSMEDGSVKQSFITGIAGIMGWTASEDNLVVFGEADVQIYDLTTGERGNQKEEDSLMEVLGENTDISGICFSNNEKTLYFADADGIFMHEMGTETVEQVLEGTMSSLVNAYDSFAGFAVSENSPLFLFDTPMQMDGTEMVKLLTYVYNAQLPRRPSKTLKIYALQDTYPTVMKSKIAKFQKKHPDIFVDYVIGMSGSEGGTKSDALRVLNTQILAGTGPDILMMDNMSIPTYAGNGMLEDLNDVVEKSISGGNMFENVVKGYQEEDVTYAIPTRFDVPMLVGTKEEIGDLKTMEDLTDLVNSIAADPNNTKMIMSAYTTQGVMSNLFIGNSQELFHPDGTLDRENLTSFLTTSKQIYDNITENADETTKMLMEMLSGDDFSEYVNQGVSSSIQDPMVDMDNVFFDKIHFAIGAYGGSGRFINFSTAMGSGKDLIYRTIPSANPNVYVGKKYIAVNSQGKQKELAKEFVSFMLSDEIQEDGLQSDLSVNRDIVLANLQENVNNALEGGGQMKITLDDGTKKAVDYVEPDDVFYQSFMDYINSLTEPMYTETQVENTIMEMGNDCLKNDADIGETVDQIITKMDLYLSE